MKKRTVAAVAGTLGTVLGAAVSRNYKDKAKGVPDENKTIQRLNDYYVLLNQWLSDKQKGKNLSLYFLENSVHTIAIYGMGELGIRLCDELKGSSVEVKYGIDREPELTFSEVEVYCPDDSLEKVDMIVVTTTSAFDEIKNMLKNKTSAPIVSLMDIVFDV